MHIFTDGSCIANPGGPGSWAFVVTDLQSELFSSSGFLRETTNNRAEMLGVIEALRWAASQPVEAIWSDSMLVVNCGAGRWKRRANSDVWAQFDAAKPSWFDAKKHLKWVRGHAGNRWNERADELCTAAIQAAGEIDYLDDAAQSHLRSILMEA